jgi:hypothetical protein
MSAENPHSPENNDRKLLMRGDANNLNQRIGHLNDAIESYDTWLSDPSGKKLGDYEDVAMTRDMAIARRDEHLKSMDRLYAKSSSRLRRIARYVITH